MTNELVAKGDTCMTIIDKMDKSIHDSVDEIKCTKKLIRKLTTMIEDLSKSESREKVTIGVGSNTVTISINSKEFEGWDSVKDSIKILLDTHRDDVEKKLEDIYDKFINIDQVIEGMTSTDNK